MYINIYKENKKTKWIYTNRLPSAFYSIYWWHKFSPGPVVGRLLRIRLSREISFPGGIVCRGGGICASSVFGRRYFFLRALFHRHLSCCVGDCWRCLHRIIREGDSSKGGSNLWALAPVEFGSGCAVTCEISKRSKCVETIPHFENFLYVIYYMVKMDSNFYA